MSAATVPPAAPRPLTPALAGLLDYVTPGTRLLLTGVKYSEYEDLLDARTAAGRAGVRIAFDHGEMEIMVVGGTHEKLKKVLALLIEAWAEENGVHFVPCGGMTHKREDLEKGFEPDECYYIQNWKKAAGLRDIDLTKDPPPDLAVEIEVSRTLLSRLPIYSAFKIPEVWRFNGTRLIVLLLQEDGSYREAPSSSAFPTVPLAEIPRFLTLTANVALSNLDILRQFRAWVRSLPPTTPKS